MAGEVLELPWNNQNKILLNGYARMKVEFPVEKCVFVGKLIPINGRKEWVLLRFEDLPLMCYGPWLRNESNLKSCFDGKNYEKRDQKRNLPAEKIGEGSTGVKYQPREEEGKPRGNNRDVEQALIQQEALVGNKDKEDSIMKEAFMAIKEVGGICKEAFMAIKAMVVWK